MKTNAPTISVVIPLYNKRDYIRRAILSVLTQKVQNIEIIVVNDGSTDKGEEIVEKIEDSRIKVIKQRNQGVSAARNRGIEESESDLIAFLDADDEWKPGFLHTILYLRERYPDAGAYGTAYEVLVLNGKTHHPQFQGIQRGWEGILPSYFRASFDLHILHPSAVAIPKCVFQKIGGFLVGEKLGEDLDILLKIALRFPIAYKNVERAVYHKEALNRTDDLPVIVEQLPYFRSAEQALRSGTVPQHLKKDLMEYVASRKIGYAKRFILRGNPREARKILRDIRTSQFRDRKRFWLAASHVPSFFFEGLRRGKARFYSLSHR